MIPDCGSGWFSSQDNISKLVFAILGWLLGLSSSFIIEYFKENKRISKLSEFLIFNLNSQLKNIKVQLEFISDAIKMLNESELKEKEIENHLPLNLETLKSIDNKDLYKIMNHLEFNDEDVEKISNSIVILNYVIDKYFKYVSELNYKIIDLRTSFAEYKGKLFEMIIGYPKKLNHLEEVYKNSFQKRVVINTDIDDYDINKYITEVINPMKEKLPDILDSEYLREILLIIANIEAIKDSYSSKMEYYKKIFTSLKLKLETVRDNFDYLIEANKKNSIIEQY